MSTRRPTAVLAAPLLLLALAASACGVSDAQIRPGLGAEVDGTELTLSEVDEITSAVCDYNAEAGESPPSPRLVERQITAVYRMREVAAEAVLEERGLELPEGYAEAVAQIAPGYADQPDSRRDLLVRNDEVQLFVRAAAQSLGVAALEEQGAAFDPETALSLGIGELDGWLAEQEVEFSPTLGVAVGDGGLVPVGSELSVAVSDRALAGEPQSAEALTALTESLPAEQVCG